MAFDWRNPERVVPWKPRQRFHLAPLGHAAAEIFLVLNGHELEASVDEAEEMILRCRDRKGLPGDADRLVSRSPRRALTGRGMVSDPAVCAVTSSGVATK